MKLIVFIGINLAFVVIAQKTSVKTTKNVVSTTKVTSRSGNFSTKLQSTTLLSSISTSKNATKKTTKSEFFSSAQSQSTTSSQVSTTNAKNSTRKKFEEWKKNNKVTYASRKEEERAARNFAANEKAINEHNNRKNVTYKQGVNDRSDKTYKEKKSTMMGAKKPDNRWRKKRSFSRFKRADEDPEFLTNVSASVDYRMFMAPVKNQGDCGCCWAFSALAVLEYQIRVKRNITVFLSDQEALDCNTDAMDCVSGGWPTSVYSYIKSFGIGSSFGYEYLAYSNDCLNDRFTRISKIFDYCELEPSGEADMRWIVSNYGPVAVSLYATESFTNYKSGVYYEEDCPEEEMNHAIVIVGYGTDPSLGDYWLIRNSWGQKWGEFGYGKIARDQGNLCGILNYAMFPCDTTV